MNSFIRYSIILLGLRSVVSLVSLTSHMITSNAMKTRFLGRLKHGLIYEPYFEEVNGFGADYYKKSGFESQRVGLQSMGLAGTYGEVLPKSIRSILATANIILNKDDVFYDLGSGTGHIVAQIAYETNCGKSIGVELGERRHKLSVQVHEKLCDAGHHSCKKMQFIKADILNTPWQSNVTCLYICCVCFPPDLFEIIKQNIRDSCPNLKYILLVGRQLHDNNDSTFIQRYDYQQLPCPATWSTSELCEVYVLKNK